MPKPGETIHRYITLDATHCTRHGTGEPRLYVSGGEMLDIEEVGRLVDALTGWLRVAAPCIRCAGTGNRRRTIGREAERERCNMCRGAGWLLP